MGEMVQFPFAGGTTGGYLAEPEQGSGPGVIVIQEWWGLVDHIKDVCDRFAAEGFVALAPDMYHGKSTKSPDEAGKLMMALRIDEAERDLSAAVDYLETQDSTTSKKVGVVGFCMGGALTVLGTVFVPEADAASSWYGFPPEGAADVTRIKIPLQLHLAEKDASFTPEAARALEAKLKGANVPFESYWYDAGHAFGNEKGQNYNKQAADLAWQRTTQFFEKHLK
jgi:carboxymethylenebutenolidase